MTYRLCTLSLIIALTSTTSIAQIIPPKSKGMNHVIISPTSPPVTKAEEESTVDSKTKKEIEKALEKPLKKKDYPVIMKPLDGYDKDISYFSKADDLEEWPYLDKLLSSNIKDQNFGIQRTEEYIERASPMILLLLAEYYSNREMNEQAAFYLYAAQMRAQFDMKRWPVVGTDESPVRDKDHPAHDTLTLSKTIAHGVTGWFVSKKSRAELILKRIEKWDAETPYAYKPTYELPSTTDIKVWKDLHNKTTGDFMKKQREMLDIIHGK